MSRNNRRRIIRVRDSELYSPDKREVVADVDILFKVLLATGLTFPSLNAKKTKHKVCARIFEIVINTMALFIVFVNIFFWQRRYSSVTLHFSTSLTIFFALSVRFVLYLSRGKIPKMIRNLVNLYDDITRRKPYKPLKTRILISCFTSLLLTAMTSVIDGFQIYVQRAKGEHSIQFLFKLNDTDGRHQKWMYHMFMALVPIKMYFAYGVSMLILIFCSSIYTIAKRIVLAYHDSIKKYNRDNHRVILTNNTLSVYLSYYNRITQCIAEIDDVLSPCVLLLYGLMVSAQFYTLTVLISNDTEPTSFTIGLHNSIVFLLTTVAFLVVTLTASKITEIAEDIKRSLQKLSEKVINADGTIVCGDGINNTYLVLVSILNGTQLTFTGWKMFNINRSFILTTMGVMISYGVIIVQIGRKYGEN